MKQWAWVVMAVVFAGCAASRVSTVTLEGVHPYLITTDECGCEEYHLKDSVGQVAFAFSASYEIDAGIVTTIVMTIENNGPDTVKTSEAYAKVTSRNVGYQYNDRFVPMPVEVISPGGKQKVTLIGKSMTVGGEDPWLVMAGEEVALTIRGMFAGRQRLPERTVRFVPKNPRFSK